MCKVESGGGKDAEACALLLAGWGFLRGVDSASFCRRLAFSRSPGSRPDQPGVFPGTARQARELSRRSLADLSLGDRPQMRQVGSAPPRSERLACRQPTATVAHRVAPDNHYHI